MVKTRSFEKKEEKIDLGKIYKAISKLDKIALQDLSLDAKQRNLKTLIKDVDNEFINREKCSIYMYHHTSDNTVFYVGRDKSKE